jgi:hypothetical protein
VFASTFFRSVKTDFNVRIRPNIIRDDCLDSRFFRHVVKRATAVVRDSGQGNQDNSERHSWNAEQAGSHFRPQRNVPDHSSTTSRVQQVLCFPASETIEVEAFVFDRKQQGRTGGVVNHPALRWCVAVALYWQTDTTLNLKKSLRLK